jgi:hypothetical protein
MSFRDWVAETVDRYRREPVGTATKRSVAELLFGAVWRLEEAGVNRGRNIYEDDWDTCAILDACRHDLYEELRGPTRSEWAIAGKSGPFLWRTFDEETARNTVYVGANPNAQKVADLPWKAYVELWDAEWNDHLETVPPEAVTLYGLAARRKYPHARLVLHYMQPHHPFTAAGYKLGGTWKQKDMVWHRLEDGRVDREHVWHAYRENLRVTLESLEDLIDGLDDERLLITSDHGNALGEWGVYGHPGGSFLPATRRVPWEFVDTGPARSVDLDVESVDLETEAVDPDRTKKRLEALGYW